MQILKQKNYYVELSLWTKYMWCEEKKKKNYWVVHKCCKRLEKEGCILCTGALSTVGQLRIVPLKMPMWLLLWQPLCHCKMWRERGGLKGPISGGLGNWRERCVGKTLSFLPLPCSDQSNSTFGILFIRAHHEISFLKSSTAEKRHQKPSLHVRVLTL